MISSANYPDMTSAIEIQWAKGWDMVPKQALQIYDVEHIERETGYISSLDGFNTAKRKREGDDFAYGQLSQNYRKTWTMQTIGLMEKITWEMRKFDKYSEIQARFRNLGNASAKKFEKDLTDRLRYAFDTSYTDNGGDSISTVTADGFALCYSAHTVTGSSTTYRNQVANNPVLSKGGLEAAEKLLNQMIDDNGELAPRTATHIITSNNPNTVNTVMEYLKSTADPTASNSGVINVYGGKYQLIKLDYLCRTASTDAYSSTPETYWFLADLTPENKRGFVKIAQEPSLVPASGNVDFETQDWKYASMASYAIEWLDGKNIIGSKGDASA